MTDTVDTALGGAVKIVQPKRGFRFSVDAILLARFASNVDGASVVDLGCGSGVVGLCLLMLNRGLSLVGLDIQEDFIKRACRSSELNGFGKGAIFRVCDFSNIAELGPRSSADIVVSNPPYRQIGEGRISSDPSVALARHEVKASLADVIHAAKYLLRRGGTFCIVYPSFRLDELLAQCRSSDLIPSELRMVHSTPSGNSTLTLLKAVNGGKKALSVLPPLYLHPLTSDGEKYSEEAIRLLGDEGTFCA